MVWSRSLSYALNRLNGFARSRIRLYPNNQTTARPGDIITLTLPNAIVDLSTFAMHFDVTTSAAGGTNPGVSLPKHIECLLDSCSVECAGVTVQQACPMQNEIFKILADYQLQDKENLRSILQNSLPIAPVANNLQSGTFAITNFLGLLNPGTTRPPVLDGGLLPETRVYFRLAPDTVLSTTGAPTSTSYTLGNIYFTCDVLDLSDLYYDLCAQRLQNGGTISVPFQQMATFFGNTGGMNQSLKWSLSTNCLNMIIGTFIDSTFNDRAYDTTTRTSHYFTRNATGLQGSQHFINSVSYPSWLAVPPDVFVQTNTALGASVDTVSATDSGMIGGLGNGIANQLQVWLGKYFLHAVRFDWPDSMDERILDGLSSRGSALQGIWNTQGTGTNVWPLLFALYTSELQIGAGRSINVVS